ncbi:MAG TPA: hypothetical protein VFN92_13010, partial [Solirubrobacterales bacterium]|nr:hypothetical protein [Solirubrobacterales bacterium]
ILVPDERVLDVACGSGNGAIAAARRTWGADELLRVTKPGGRIGVASWCPDGGLQDFFAAIVKHTGGPPPGAPPVLWGDEAHVRELFGDSVSELRAERLKSRQAFRSAEHYIGFFRDYFGPIKTAFEAVGPEGEAELTADLERVLDNLSTGGQRALVVEPEYLQVIAVRA